MCIDEFEAYSLVTLKDGSIPLKESHLKRASIIAEKINDNKSFWKEKCNCDKLVTLGKTVTIKTYLGVRRGLNLVLPTEENLMLNKLSILSAVGTAIYMEQEGAVIPCMIDNELDVIEILEVLPTTT